MSMLARKEEPWPDSLLPPEVTGVLSALQRQAPPVILKNRGEGGSVIGTDVVAKAPPNGYSILMVAPAGTSGDIIAKLNKELVAVMRMPDVEGQLRRQGIEPMTGTPGEFAAFLRSDIKIPNPAGLVPVLVDGGQVLIESRIINEYLEDAYPQPRLCPEGAYARARMRLWTKYAEEEATEAVKLPSFVNNIQPELQRMPREEAFAAILDRLLHHAVTLNIRGNSYRLKEKLKAGLVRTEEAEA